MLGDPQLIGLVAMKLPFDPVAGGGHAWDVAIARAPRNALIGQPGASASRPPVADGDVLPEDRAGMDTPGAVGAARGMCTGRISSVSHAWRIARAEGARKRRA